MSTLLLSTIEDELLDPESSFRPTTTTTSSSSSSSSPPLDCFYQPVAFLRIKATMSTFITDHTILTLSGNDISLAGDEQLSVELQDSTHNYNPSRLPDNNEIMQVLCRQQARLFGQVSYLPPSPPGRMPSSSSSSSLQAFSPLREIPKDLRATSQTPPPPTAGTRKSHITKSQSPSIPIPLHTYPSPY
jgi:hypothetical protein